MDVLERLEGIRARLGAEIQEIREDGGCIASGTADGLLGIQRDLFMLLLEEGVIDAVPLVALQAAVAPGERIIPG